MVLDLCRCTLRVRPRTMRGNLQKWLQACPKFTLTGGWKGYVGECSGVREEAFSVELMKSTENIWYENVFAFLPSAPRESTNATSGACGIAAVW